jgi:16S rRNA U1498 N3-methylase RsmE
MRANRTSDLPHTPLILLSALVEGADRLVARVALELGVHFIVPLPMPRDIYETDWQSFSTSAQNKETR